MFLCLGGIVLGKHGSRLFNMDDEIKKLRITTILTLAFFVTIITAASIAAAIYNSRYAEPGVAKTCNYVVLILAYLLITILASLFAFEHFENRLGNYVDTDKLTSGINYEKFLRDSQNRLLKVPGAYAVFYADILNFKYINDTFGYDVGDNLLMFISQKLREKVKSVDGLYARVSADNYAVLIPYQDKNEFAEEIYSLIDDVCWFEDIQKENYKPEIYVGIYCTGAEPNTLTISEMIDRAIMAQKSVKGSSEYHIAFYTEEIRERVIAEKELERRMESALANGEFTAYFQPKYCVDTGEIVGAEALVRWISPESGFMSPGKFIPLFEQNGFVINLDQYVFETVCKNMREWLDSGIKVVPVSINVSRLQFYKLDFVKRYTKIKEKYNIPDGLLELEFTESIVFENLEILKKIVLSLKKVGFSCSVDDFGSGYSSLNVLKNLPMDTLKLDKLFFDDSENLSRDKALISSVINMARALDMKTVAEGIENWAQVAFLKEIGCDIIQGYVYSEPIPYARFTTLLEGNRRKEMPIEVTARDIENPVLSEAIANAKYAAVLGILDGMLLEVDFNTNEFGFIGVSSVSKTAEAAKRALEASGTSNYDEALALCVENFVHPDDVKTIQDRCSSIAIMSAFYQKEVKIITECRLMMKTSGKYEWAKVTISRISKDSDTDFRAFVYIEPRRPLPDERKKIEDESIASVLTSAVQNICALVYEVNLDNRSFRQLFCNTDLIGEQPEEGDVSWLMECYIPKVVDKSDLERFLHEVSPEHIESEIYKAGKNKVEISGKATFKGKPQMHIDTIIARKNISIDNNKYYVFMQAQEIDK